MSPNSDNAMARFLFAILKQKNLKDVDWDQVAQDPVLLQPIANGHAARMRFSRFRATVTGHQPQKRGRQGDKSRVPKPKKESQSDRGTIIKSESGISLSSYAQFSDASPCFRETTDGLSSRFLTPCSDDMAHTMSCSDDMAHTMSCSDDMAHTMSCNDDMAHTMSGHGAAVDEWGNHGVANGFAQATDGSPGFANHAVHSPVLDAFNAAYEISNYGAGAESADLQSRCLSDTCATQPLADCGQAWNGHFNNDAPLF